MTALRIIDDPASRHLLIHRGKSLLARIVAPVELILGPPDHHERVRLDYETLERRDQGWIATAGHRGVRVKDTWSIDDAAVHLHRHISTAGPGTHVRLRVELESMGARFFAPGMAYQDDQWREASERVFADHRLAYPLVGAHLPDDTMLWLLRETTATFDDRPSRRPGDSVYEHRTDIGAIGFSTDPHPALIATWPYGETDTSSMLDSQGTPAVALYPGQTQVEITYRLACDPAPTYADGVRAAFMSAYRAAVPEPTSPSVSLAESIDLRLNSAAQTYRDQGEEGVAGFVLNFDPDRGYQSEARAFGASFADHGMAGSRGILEYGFTGRQLNLAALLAQRDPGWTDRADRVVESFTSRMVTDSGWLYTLWHTGRNAPLYSCGDPSGPVMHYLGESHQPGTFTRMMCEAASDLLLNVQRKAPGSRQARSWLGVARQFGDFLLSVQETDGSWFRAYAPSGQALRGSWLGEGEAGKASTGAVVPYLLALAAASEDGARYEAAAVRAADYVLHAQVPGDSYRGGTLDNPNLVDKEAAFIAMRALWQAYGHTEDAQFLDGARRAAILAATWHSVWRVPHVPGTHLARAGVNSIGWGGINPTWGVGVTDIYSLFYLEDLHRVGRATGEELLVDVARLAAHSSLQILAVPGALHGMTDTGMQPEGIAFCSQGTDEGLITKGDTWGGLGWPYTAGTFGLSTYLNAVADDPPTTNPT